MDAILRKLGRAQGSVKDRIEQLKKDLSYPLTEDGRTRIMADVDEILRDAEKRAAPQFDRRPKAPVVARPFRGSRKPTPPPTTPPRRAMVAARDLSDPAAARAHDEVRPAVARLPRDGARAITFRSRSSSRTPTCRSSARFAPSGRSRRFSEGWGLYAERLAAEIGWYDGDPEGLLGQLDSALFRARRLVVDTGLHAKRWTRQQAIDYGIEASEVERYVVNPGQACSYMIGQLKIVELREKARAALGTRFSIREFHNVVLGTGTVPLDLLERQVDAYIRSSRGL